jgi:hypothetical protein
VRYLVDLQRTADNGVEGSLRREGDPDTIRFSGWMELMSLLEPPLEPPAPHPGRARPAAAAEAPLLGGPF